MSLLHSIKWSSLSKVPSFFYRRLQYPLATHKYNKFSVRDTSSLEVLLDKFGELTTDKEKLSIIVNCANDSSPERFVMPSSEAARVVYGVVRTNCYTSAAECIHSVLMEYDRNSKYIMFLCSCVYGKAHMINFGDSLLCSRALATIDEEKCSKSFIGLLRTKLYGEIGNNRYIPPWDVMYCIYIMNAFNNLDYNVVRSLRGYLSSDIHRYKLNWSVRHALELSKRAPFKDVTLYDSLKVSVLSLVNREVTSGRNHGSYYSLILKYFLKLSLIEQEFCSIFFQSIKEAVLSEYLELSPVNAELFKLILDYCISCKIYDEILFDRIVQIFLVIYKMIPNSLGFTAEVLYKFRRLNYKSGIYLNEMVQVAEENFDKSKSFYQLYRQILRYCIYLNIPHPSVLRRYLTNDMQDQQAYYKKDTRGCLNYPEFLVWLCVENKHLGYTKYIDMANCESYPYQIKNVHDKYSMKYLSRPISHVSNHFSFDCHLSVITGGFYQKNAFTVSGHHIDYEILLGDDEEFIKFPSFLRNIPYSRGFVHIHGFSERDVERDSSSKVQSYKNLLRLLLECEGKNVEDQENKKHDINNCNPILHEVYNEPVNFASDWGKFLQNDNEQMPNFKKKIAIIFYTHYIGEVEVRVRQLEAMGWSVVLIPKLQWRNIGMRDSENKEGIPKVKENYILDKLTSF